MILSVLLAFISPDPVLAVMADGQQPVASHSPRKTPATLSLSSIPDLAETGLYVCEWTFANILSELTTYGQDQNFVLSLPEMDSPVERSPPGGGYETLLTDHLMSVIGAVDDTGAVVRTTGYLAYGGVQPGTVDPGPVGFAGARRDPRTGLVFLRNRVYDPEVMRFLSRDPIGFAGGWNRYGYVAGNPVHRRDPLGLVVGLDPVSIGARAAVGGLIGAGLGGVVGAWREGWPGLARGIVSGGAAGAAAGATFGWTLVHGTGAATIISGAIGGGTGAGVESVLRGRPAGQTAQDAVVGAVIGGGVGAAAAGVGRILGRAASQCPPRADGLTGPLGSITAQELEAAMTGPVVQVFTRLTQAPAPGRALSAAVGEGAETLAQAAREGGQLYVAAVPRFLLARLEGLGLLTRTTTEMGGVRAIEYRFTPQAMNILAPLFRRAAP